MDIETFLFILFVAFFGYGGLVFLIGLFVEWIVKEELDFDDVEGIKKAIKEDGKL